MFYLSVFFRCFQTENISVFLSSFLRSISLKTVHRILNVSEIIKIYYKTFQFKKSEHFLKPLGYFVLN